MELQILGRPVKKLTAVVSTMLIAITISLSSCETDITLDLPEPAERLVVEGFIETDAFPYVILARNFSFFSGLDPGDLQNQFVHNASVVVNDGQTDHTLTEFCLNSLPDSLKQLVLDYFGLTEAELNGQDFCAYVSLSFVGQEGKTYTLSVDVDTHHIEAVTSIPRSIPVDSLWTEPAGIQPDSLKILWLEFDEPDTFGNYYRYWTQTNSEPFYPGYFGSVLDDQFFNGEAFRFTLERGYAPNADIDFSTYGLFGVGDTVVVRIAMIDQVHYEFWRTADEQRLGGGPFGTPVYINTNVTGGLGIWGGYGAVYDSIIVQ